MVRSDRWIRNLGCTRRLILGALLWTCCSSSAVESVDDKQSPTGPKTVMVVRSVTLSPYSGARYNSQLLEHFTHVVTVYLPSSAADNHWRSEQYASRIDNALQRWKPSLVISSEVDLSVFDIHRDGVTVKNVKPVGINAVVFELCTRLHGFLKKTGLGDMKFYLLYRPEYGPLYDDIVKEAGFEQVTAIPVQNVGNLRKALASIPRGPDVAIINALTHVDNPEFGTVMLAREVAAIVRGKGVLDLSVVDSAPGAISVTHEAPVLDLVADVVRGGKITLRVDPSRLKALGLNEVYVEGFPEIDSIIR